MNGISTPDRRLPRLPRWTPLAALLLSLSAAIANAATAPGSVSRGLAPCSSTSIAEPLSITLGKSTLLRLPNPAVRLVVGGLPSGYAGKPQDSTAAAPLTGQPAPQAGSNSRLGVAEVDVLLLGPRELYLLGKHVGSMNLILQNPGGQCTVMDIAVTMDAGSLQSKLGQLMPDDKDIKVAAAEDTLIISGEVSSALKVDRAISLATAYAPEKKVINLMRVSTPQQVMLEVKVAEVSKTLLDKLAPTAAWSNGFWNFAVSSGLLAAMKVVPNPGVLAPNRLGVTRAFEIEAQKKDGLVKILAEPNIMAISGQEGSFLAGGKIFIPVARANGAVGGTTITLEEKEFGVGLKFTPTVLDGGGINLKVAPEVSELSQTGSPFTTLDGTTSVLPSFTVRRAQTTVQLNDGQSFAIAGLIKNNVTESMKRLPGLGEIPILGALFSSNEFQTDQTELMFVITPRLVKPLPPNYALPTDHFVPPSRNEFLLGGKMEGSTAANDVPAPAPTAAPATPASGGFDVK